MPCYALFYPHLFLFPFLYCNTKLRVNKHTFREALAGGAVVVVAVAVAVAVAVVATVVVAVVGAHVVTVDSRYPTNAFREIPGVLKKTCSNNFLNN